MVDKESKKEEIKLTADGIYTSDPDLNLSLNVGTLTEMVMVDPLETREFSYNYSYSGTPDMFDAYEEKELREKFPSLQRAWENYKILVQLCRSELEKDED